MAGSLQLPDWVYAMPGVKALRGLNRSLDPKTYATRTPFGGEEYMPANARPPVQFGGEEWQPPMPSGGDEVGVSTPASMDDNGGATSQVGGDRGFVYSIPPMGRAAGSRGGESTAGIGLPTAPGMAPRGMPAENATSPEQDMQSAYDKASEAARARVAAILSKGEGAGISNRDKWLSVALAGAHMAGSRNPTFFGGLGEGAAAGIQNFTQLDQRARQEALRRTQTELEGEGMAERAGDRAENRVIKREEIGARKQGRLDALQARKEDLEARRDDARLSREERAHAAQLANETRLEIAKLTVGGRENVANIAAQARRDASAARAAGGDPARIREASTLVERGVAPDFPTAYRMVRTGTNEGASYQSKVQAEKKMLMPRYTDAMGRLTISNEDLEELAVNIIEGRAKRGGTLSGPAAGAAAPQAAPAAKPPLSAFEQ